MRLLAIALFLAACSSDSNGGATMNWTITSPTAGTQTCLDVSASTVEWTFHSDSDKTLTFDCVDSGQSTQLPTGEYTIEAKLKRSDGVVLSTCTPNDCGTVLTTDNPFNCSCDFSVTP